ncbi:MAG TPA: dihydroorotase [Saprospirales bacterium]|nr:dihydroorotase [Saprospirales bacterium]
MRTLIIKDAQIINEHSIIHGDIFIRDGRIEQIAPVIHKAADRELVATGKWVIPGVIDDQVHFRQPGMEYKADIFTESRAALAGGVTSFMEMPNTKPPTLTQEALDEKYNLGKTNSAVNYSFYMGASNDNLEEVLKTDPKNVCGIKVFMGSSTGNMLVDDEQVLESLFSSVPMLIATHCEDERTIRSNQESYYNRYKDGLHARFHPEIRSDEACYLSSSKAVALAKKYGTRLHVLHLTSAKEMSLFSNEVPLKDKRITSEVCVHHLYYNDMDYERLGNGLKCNPAVKSEQDRIALWEALMDDRLDVIATDHAPHTIEEKSEHYLKAPSGLPLVQHSLYVMLDFYTKGMITLEQIVHKMCHAPAEVFRVKERGYIREGYWADLVVLDMDHRWEVNKGNLLAKCKWSTFEGTHFNQKISHTLVNGQVLWENDRFIDIGAAQRLEFIN